MINQAKINLNRSEKALLKLGPKYIPNNPRLAHIRIGNEIDVVVKKVNRVFVEHGWVLPKQRLQIFIDSLKKILIDCHDRHPPSVQLKEIGRLRNKFEVTQTIIRKTDKFKVKKEEAELAHLYFLPKAHKPGSPLRLIMSGLKSPTIRISKWLDGLLRPLFDRLACDTTIPNGGQLIKLVERWSAIYLTSATSFKK
jgi:hypothetical protein